MIFAYLYFIFLAHIRQDAHAGSAVGLASPCKGHADRQVGRKETLPQSCIIEDNEEFVEQV